MNGEQNLSHNYYVNLVSYSDKVSLDDYVIVEIKPKSIEITSASQTKLYSEGAKLINNKVTVTLGELVENQKLLAVANGVLDQIGSIPNPINPETVVILDANGDDVTYNYVITIKYGTLTFLEDSD